MQFYENLVIATIFSVLHHPVGSAGMHKSLHIFNVINSHKPDRPLRLTFYITILILSFRFFYIFSNTENKSYPTNKSYVKYPIYLRELIKCMKSEICSDY